MAELQFDIKTNWQEIRTLANELDKLNTSLRGVNTEVPRKEVDELIVKLSELSKVYHSIDNSISFNVESADKIEVGNIDTSSAKEAEKTVGSTIDAITDKINTLREGINSVAEVLGNISVSSSLQDTISNLRDIIVSMGNATERQSIALANQAQQYDEIAAQRVEREKRVQQEIEETTAKIEEQTEKINEQNESVKEKPVSFDNIKEVEPELSYTDELKERIKSNREEIKRLTEEAMSLTSDTEEQQLILSSIDEKTRYLQEAEQKLESVVSKVGTDDIQKNINEIDDDIAELRNIISEGDSDTPLYKQVMAFVEERLQRKEELVARLSAFQSAGGNTDSSDTGVGAGIFQYIDEAGNKFEILADSQEDVNRIIEQGKNLLEIYPDIMDRILDKISEMRKSGTMTAEAEAIEKKVISIGDNLAQLQTLGDVLKSERNGEDPLESFEKLSEYEEKLQGIKEEQEEAARVAKENELIRQEEIEKGEALRTKIYKAREELARMIDEGKDGTPEFVNLAQEAGELQEQMRYASAQMAYFGNQTRYLDVVKTGFQGVAGAIGLVNGVMGIFNTDSKKMIEIQTKVQSVLGIVVGLETTYNLVKKESIIRLAFEEVRTWALAKARGVQAAATTAATVAEEGMNKAMTKNPYGAIIALAIAFVGALWMVIKALTSETEEEKKAREERERHIKAIQEQNKKWTESVSSSTAQQVMAYRKLQRQWSELGDDIKAKSKFIKEHKNDFNNLGFAVNSVTDAENILVNNTDAVVAAFRARAKAAAYQELMTDAYKKQVQEELKKDITTGDLKYVYQEGTGITEKQWNARYGKGSGKDFKFGKDYSIQDGMYVLTEEGAKKINKLEAKRTAQAREQKNQRIKDRQNEVDKLSELQEKELKQEQKILKEKGIKPSTEQKSDKSGGGGKDNSEANRIKEEQRLSQELLDLRKKAERARVDAEIAAEKDEYIRQRKEREEQHKRNREDILAKENDIYKAIYEQRKKAYENLHKTDYETDELGKLGWQGVRDSELSDDEKEYFNLRYSIVQDELKKEDALWERYNYEQQKTLIEHTREYLKKYGSFYQQQLSITEDYEERIRKARSLADKGEELRLIREQREDLGRNALANITSGIDWNALLQNVSAIDKEQKEYLRNQLREFTKTEKYQSADMETKKKTADLINELNKYLGSADSGITELINAINNFNTTKDAYDYLVNIEKGAYEKYQAAVAALNTAKESGAGEDIIKQLSADVEEARQNLNNAGNEVSETQEKLRNFSTALNQASLDVRGYVGEFEKNITNLAAQGVDIGSLNSVSGELSQAIGLNNEKVAKILSNDDRYIEAQEALDSGEIDQARFDEVTLELLKEVGGLKGSILSAEQGLLNGVDNLLGNAVGSLLGNMTGLLALPKLIVNISHTVSDFATGIMDGITDFLRLEWLSNFVEKILGSLDDLIDAVLDLPESIAHALEGIIMSVGDMAGGLIDRVGNIVTLGGLGSGWLVGGADYSEVEGEIARYEHLASVWDDLIAKKKEYMGISIGAEALRYGKYALEIAEWEVEAQRKIARAALGSGASAGSHSIEHRMWEGSYAASLDTIKGAVNEGYESSLSNSVTWNRVNKAIEQGLEAAGYGKVTFDKLEDLFDMSNEQLTWIKANYSGLWANMDGSFREALENTMKLREEQEDILDELREKLTGTSVDEVYNDLLDKTWDFVNGTENAFDTVADNWQEMANKMLLTNILGNKTKEKIKKWYEEFSTEIEKLEERRSKGEISQEEYLRLYKELTDNFGRQYQNIGEDAKNEAQRLKDMGVVTETEDSEDRASSGGFKSMSQESADTLNGRFTSVDLNIIRGNAIAEQILTNITSLAQVAAINGGTMEEIRDLVYTQTTYLFNIMNYNKEMSTFGGKIDNLYSLINQKL